MERNAGHVKIINPRKGNENIQREKESTSHLNYPTGEDSKVEISKAKSHVEKGLLTANGSHIPTREPEKKKVPAYEHILCGKGESPP